MKMLGVACIDVEVAPSREKSFCKLNIFQNFQENMLKIIKIIENSEIFY